MRRDQAYMAYLKENPRGNFTRFTHLSQAGKRLVGDPTAAPRSLEEPAPGAVSGAVEPLAHVGPGPAPTQPVRGGERSRSTKELRRKIAWAVGSAYGVKYAHYDSWPADYARRAAERLIEIHGEP